MTALVPTVATAAAAHTAAAPNVHTLTAATLTDAEKATLIDGYDGRSAEVRRLLEAMRASLPTEHLETCPFCNLDSRAELDHFLPKTRHHEFALHALNLIPICPVCSKSKGTIIADKTGKRAVLMPTMDTACMQPVLAVKLTMLAVPAVTYSINPGSDLSPTNLSLVQRHFRWLKLADRYRRRATSLMLALKLGVKSSCGTRQLARATIDRGLATARIEEPVNSWRTALYEAIHLQATAFEDWMIA